MNNEFSFLALFILGLFSSFHCIGMCGGVIGALTFGLEDKIRQNKFQLIIFIAAYNLGRLISYALAGIVVGLIGTTLVGFIGMGNAHDIIRYMSAIMIFAVGLYVAGWFPYFSRLDKLGAKLWKRIQPLGKRFLPVKKPWQSLGFGLIWGWIPCGLVYSALLLASLGGSATNGGLAMLAFGLGTLPAVMGAGLVTGGLSQWLQKPRVRQVFGVLMIALAAKTLMVPMDHSAHMNHDMHNDSAVESDEMQPMNHDHHTMGKGMKCGG